MSASGGAVLPSGQPGVLLEQFIQLRARSSPPFRIGVCPGDNPDVTSGAFADALEQAEEQLWLSFEKTKGFQHSGLKGTGREDAVAEFLEEHLPRRFGIARGEAFDSRQGRSGQLDLVIYDRMSIRPLPISEQSSLLPSEALLAVVEVKSTLTRDEVRKSLTSAGRIFGLKPYKKEFAFARSGGVDASDQNPRCLYTIFAFDSDLSPEGLLEKEAARLRDVADEVGVPVQRIDRVVVLERGMLLPPDGRGLANTNEAKMLLREWFLHLTNFLIREAPRRKAFEWEQYVNRKRGLRFSKLDGYEQLVAETEVPGEAGSKANARKHSATARLPHKGRIRRRRQRPGS
jgi:hypothetical protein